MSPTRVPVFACLILAILCIHSTNGQVQRVRSLHRQCTDQGFAGVCSVSTRNPTGRGYCSRALQCAVRVGGRFLKQPGGRIPDGTLCGSNRICRNRRCVATPRMPQVVGPPSSVACGRVVSRAERIRPRPIRPL